jgi:hypothetical protein
MSSEIDWSWMLAKFSIAIYLDKYDTLDLSLVNKKIRDKLYPVIFNQMEINYRVLLQHSNFFDQKRYRRFGNLSYMEKIKKFKKYGLNDQLAFKELQIDPFIEESNITLKSASMYCKSLTFDSKYRVYDDRPSYFIFPLFESFYNLNNLTLYKYSIPFISFYNLLSKLENLEILNMRLTILVLTPSDDPNLAIFLKYPKSLKELTYVYVLLGNSYYYDKYPLSILNDPKFNLIEENLDIMPQLLPNLKILNARIFDLTTTRMRKFLALNPDAKVVYYHFGR